MTYRFKYRTRLFWRSVTVQGHRFDQSLDKMILYTPDGGVQEIAQWSFCDLKLGRDWAVVVKKEMETKAGQTIPVGAGVAE